MEPTIIGFFKNEEDAKDAANELSMLGVDNIVTRTEEDNTIIEVKFSEVTGIRNVFEKRNAFEIREVIPERE